MARNAKPRKWLLVDFLGLAGLLSSVIYWVWRVRYPNYSGPITELSPNLLVGAIDVWLSVRIINTLLGRHDSWERHRRSASDALREIGALSREMIPAFADHRIRSFASAITCFQERFEGLGDFLSEDEMKDVTRVIVVARNLAYAVNDYADQVREAADAKMEAARSLASHHPRAQAFELSSSRFDQAWNAFQEYPSEKRFVTLVAVTRETFEASDLAQPTDRQISEWYKKLAKDRVRLALNMALLDDLILRARRNILEELR